MALLSLGCQSPREKFEAAARETLKRLPLLAAVARDAPSLNERSSDGLKAVGDLSLKFKHSNALLTHLEELANPSVRWALPIRLNHRSPAVDVATALGAVEPVSDDQLEANYDPACGPDSSDWQLMGEARYALVVRTRAVIDAAMTGEKTFKGGQWVGEVMLFGLADRKFIGGFAVTGGSHAFVQTRLGRDLQNLNADLALAARGNLNAELRKYFSTVGPNDEAN